ncbi:hypothetical protein PMIN01_03796 [Paraphaeosphaeria minitans]|uniref:Uncharacterized protein n=1 Tax=Paraphaeosphaeria minitans TaxID=565426 RepID=A0A9P6GN98_9PLEO|nr:hypothetical protein PMIN01_03796 [Paraphaeosphaeria minitans]
MPSCFLQAPVSNHLAHGRRVSQSTTTTTHTRSRRQAQVTCHSTLPLSSAVLLQGKLPHVAALNSIDRGRATGDDPSHPINLLSMVRHPCPYGTSPHMGKRNSGWWYDGGDTTCTTPWEGTGAVTPCSSHGGPCALRHGRPDGQWRTARGYKHAEARCCFCSQHRICLSTLPTREERARWENSPWTTEHEKSRDTSHLDTRHRWE